MEKRLYQAAVEGNVPSLLMLLRDDPLLLDRSIVGPCTESPLHVASLLGHVEFVNEILSRKPHLALELDSQGSAPLHLAAAKGYLDIVKSLLVANPEMCFTRDKFGRNPIHVAAMKGRLEVLTEMIGDWRGAALQRMSNGDTILHLCVRNNKLESLKVLVERFGDRALLNSKNSDGDTMLHLAATDQQTETIYFLTKIAQIDTSSPNQKGLTALDILAQAKAKNAQAPINYGLSRNEIELAAEGPPTIVHPLPEREQQKKNLNGKDDWLEKMSSSLMVVAILTATMAFQVGVNPPGGIWQDTFKGDAVSSPHAAGFSIMADNHPSWYSRLLYYNTVSFIASLTIILLLISGLPLKRKIFVRFLMLIMWVNISCNATTYIISIHAFSPDHEKPTVIRVMYIVALVWDGLMVLLLTVHTIRLFLWLMRKKTWKTMRMRNNRPISIVSTDAAA